MAPSPTRAADRWSPLSRPRPRTVDRPVLSRVAAGGVAALVVALTSSCASESAPGTAPLEIPSTVVVDGPAVDGSVADDAASGETGAPDSVVAGSAVDTVPTDGPTEVSTEGPATSTANDGGAAEPDAVGVRPVGFPLVGVRITDTDGGVCEVCMWLADTDELRGRGLMGVTDLGAAAGMVFAYARPTAGAFYMYRTPTPLDIHWVDSGGTAVVATTMEPCLDTAASECPRHRPGREYVTAIETFPGGADEIGLSVGSTVELISAVNVCAEVLRATS